MKRYKMTLTILSPVHIGSGQDIDPTEYVVKDDIFYRLDLPRFLSQMPPALRAEFDQRVTDPNPFAIRDFIRRHADPKKFACFSADATTFQHVYDQSVDNPDRQLEVNLFTRTPGTWHAYIPGSSIKGAIRTAVVSEWAKTKKLNRGEPIDPKWFEKNVLGYQDAKQDPFRCVRISDAQLPESPTFIDRAKIFKLAKTPGGPDPSGILMFYEQTFSMLDDETIQAQGTLDIDDLLPQKQVFDKRQNRQIPAVSKPINALDILLKACRQFYLPKMEHEHQKFYRSSPELEENSRRLLDVQYADNEFPIRLGRFSHVECTTVDDFRKPYNSRGYGKSRTLSGGTMPMGWVKVRLDPISE